MFYEEKMIDGILMYRHTTDEKWKPIPPREMSHRIVSMTERNNFLINKLMEADKKQKWIKVEDRLPEFNVEVLTYGENGIFVAIFDRFTGWETEYTDETWLTGEGVPTHWMPIPEPPEG